MNNELPRTIQDVPYRNGYEGKKIWTILGKNKRLSGSFKISDENASLEFEIPREEVEEFKIKIIAKTTAIGNSYSRILLINSSVWESPFSRVMKSEKGRMRLNPSLIVIQGSAKRVKEDITTLTGYLPGIGEWFKEDLLAFDNDEYKFQQPKTIYHEIPLGKSAKIILNAKLTIDHESTIIDKKFTAYPESFVRIEFAKPTPIGGTINIFSHVENFFNFIFSTPHATHIFTSNMSRKGKRIIPLYILSPQRHKDYRREEKRHEVSMLFAWEDVSNINDVFVQWLLQYDRIHEIVDTLVLLKSTRVSEEMRFTTIINALEAVHRRYYDHKLQVDEDYKKRVEAIVQKITEDEDKKLVSRRLEFGNEISLHNRLKEVYAIGEKHGIPKPEKQTTDKIIATRNYFAHGDEARKKDTLHPNDLFYVNSLLGRYLKLILLQILGVNETELAEIVKKSSQFQTFYRDEPPIKNTYLF